MAPLQRFEHEFVDHIPDQLEPGFLYVSMRYATVIHLCACGCGQQAVTPLDPTDHKLTFDGETITLRPSIGNWRFPCRSHYFITNSRVRWAGDMTDEAIATGWLRDRQTKERAWAAPVQASSVGPVAPSTRRLPRGLSEAFRRPLRK